MFFKKVECTCCKTPKRFFRISREEIKTYKCELCLEVLAREKRRNEVVKEFLEKDRRSRSTAFPKETRREVEEFNPLLDPVMVATYVGGSSSSSESVREDFSRYDNLSSCISSRYSSNDDDAARSSYSCGSNSSSSYDGGSSYSCDSGSSSSGGGCD